MNEKNLPSDKIFQSKFQHQLYTNKSQIKDTCSHPDPRSITKINFVEKISRNNLSSDLQQKFHPNPKKDPFHHLPFINPLSWMKKIINSQFLIFESNPNFETNRGLSYLFKKKMIRPNP